jgi:hypothetical protein
MRTAIVLALLAACDPDPLCETRCEPPDIERETVLEIKAIQNPDLDLLFVIDDSPSMLDKQNAFARAFPALVARLATIEGGTPNLQLGVISPDMGTKGAAVVEPGPQIGQPGAGGCAGSGKAGTLQTGRAMLAETSFLRSARDGSRNFAGTIEDAFTQMTALGAGGCGFEQPLHALRASFENESNTGFLRPGANLAVVVLSDEDDCSVSSPELFESDTARFGQLQSFRCFRFGVECAEDEGSVGVKTQCRPAAAGFEDVTEYADILRGVVDGDARRVMFGAIVGDTTRVEVEERVLNNTPQPALAHACRYPVTNGEAVADPAVRLAAFANELEHSTITSVCSDDLVPQATAIGNSIKRLVGDPCLPRAIPDDCIVEDKRDSESFARTLFECAGAEDSDCFAIVDDPVRCAEGPRQRLEIRRRDQPADDLWSTLRCAI